MEAFNMNRRREKRERKFFDPYMEEKEAGKTRKSRKGLIAAGVLLLLFLFLFLFGYSSRLTDISVVGNSRYTEDELISMIFKKDSDFNTFYTLYRNRFGEPEDIPFVEKYRVKVTGFHSAKIIVYEKSIAGCIEYMGSYMYFDREGIIVESSKELEEGVPLVTGIKFKHIVMYQKLEVGDEDVFAEILNISQLLSQYGLFGEQMVFDKNRNVTLVMGEIRAVLGDDAYLAEKIAELSDMYSELSGRSGTVYLNEYRPDVKNPSYPFVPDE